VHPRFPAELRKRFGGAREFAEKMIAQKEVAAAGKAERFLLTYDPKPALQKVRCPVLALFGQKDGKVVAAANRGPLGEALPRDGDLTTVLIPGADHLFQDEGATTPPRFVPGLVDMVSGWIRTRVAPRQAGGATRPRP
jgi:pimeloyl-ACP methyl ester carboxylesterase